MRAYLYAPPQMQALGDVRPFLAAELFTDKSFSKHYKYFFIKYFIKYFLNYKTCKLHHHRH